MNDWGRAALEIVWKDGIYITAYPNDGEINHVIDLVPTLRRKYKSATPPKLRREIIGWLDFFEDRAKNGKRNVEALNERVKRSTAETDRRQIEAKRLAGMLKL